MAGHHEIKDHEHGSMDISEHRKTFAGFVKVMTWGIIVTLITLIFMALVNA